MTLGQAAELLEWRDRWGRLRLLRMLRRMEAELGRDLMIRCGGRGNGLRYRVTRAVLEKYLGLECRHGPNTAKLLREFMVDKSAEMRELRERVEDLEERVGILAERESRRVANERQ